MGNRMLKESIRTSKSVNSLSDFQFRLWVHLITYVDDFGRGSADPELIKSFAFPRRKSVTERQIYDAMAILANTGMINLYEVDGESYFYFPKWTAHQRIQAQKSRYPDPEAATSVQIVPPSSTVLHGESRCSTVSHGESPSEVEVEVEEELSKKERVERKKFSPPSLEDVKNYAVERNSSVDPVAFYEFYSAGQWVDSNGNPVRNWKQKFLTWESRDKNKGNQRNTVHSGESITAADVKRFMEDNSS